MKDPFYESVVVPANPIELPPILTVKHIGKFLGIHKNGAYSLVRRSDFPSITIGRKIIIYRDAFIRWLEEESTRPFEKKKTG